MFCFIQAPESFATPTLKDLSCLLDETAPSRTRLLLYSRQSQNRNADDWLDISPQRIACFDGVLINGSDLVTRYAHPSLTDFLDRALTFNDHTLISNFHGQFAAMSYDRAAGTGSFYTNQTNSSRLYFYQQNEVFICSPSMSLIVDVLKAWKIPFEVDETGARMLLYYGYTLENFTTVSGIRLLKAGQVLELDNGKLRLESYHSFNNTPFHNDLNRVLPELNELFCQAVKHEYSHDAERKLGHLAFLSGGLDSRMSLFTAASLGFKDIECLNFSQTKYLDHSLAEEISRALGYKLHFYPLDDGSCLQNLETGMLYNDGQIIMHGAVHLYSAINSLPTEGYGVFHSGQIGDLILGSFLQTDKHEASNIRPIGLSGRTDPELEHAIKLITRDYANAEIYALYNRGFNAASNGDLAASLTNHSISPFLYPPFAQYCLNISPALRYNNQLYFEWFRRYQSNAAKIAWEKTGLNLYAGSAALKAASILRRGRNKLAAQGIGGSYGMNPFQHWYSHNPALRDSLEQRFAILPELEQVCSPSLRKAMAGMFASERVSDKLNAYTLAYGLRSFFTD